MIYVDQSQLNQVEYLIGQSILGNHVLFDVETLREVFTEKPLEKAVRKPRRSPRPAPRAKREEDAGGHIEKLIAQPSIAEKRAYLERLDRGTFARVVRTYFNIVENNLFEQLEATH